MRFWYAVAVALASCTSASFAETADRDRPTVIEADRGVFDDLKQVNVLTGKVTLTKGTLRITGERMELRQHPDGYRSAVVTAAADGLATFRQRRDPTRPGVEEIIAGVAERIEWDERSDSVRFVSRAKWQRLENGVLRDEISGSLITYDATRSTYRVDGGDGNGGRVRAVIAPRDSTPSKGEPAPLRMDSEAPVRSKP